MHEGTQNPTAIADELRASQRHIIERPRLTTLLDEADARVILLVAPAGYGKTTLAREWLGQRDRTGLWYPARSGASSVAALARGLARAVSPVSPGADKTVREFLVAHPEPDPELLAQLYFIQNATGGVMAPLESYLCSRGLKTLELRVHEQCRTAQLIAEYLQSHPKVQKTHYPGLEQHPSHHIARRQMQGGFGAMLSFEVDGGFAAAKRFVESTKLFQLAVSLGSVESLIEQPASMSHASYDPADRRAHGISDGLIRLSVGLEAFEDLREDLDRAFSAL
jgi:hypothetical protein